MTDDVQNAFDELRNAIWMLVIPLVLGIIALIGYFQWMIQDLEWAERLQDFDLSLSGEIYEVETSECIQPKPTGVGHICAQSTDWWSPTDSMECQGGQCYMPAYLNEFIAVLDELDSSYMPIWIPGLLPLIFLFVVIRKITNARRSLKAALESQSRYRSVSENTDV